MRRKEGVERKGEMEEVKKKKGILQKRKGREKKGRSKEEVEILMEIRVIEKRKGRKH